MDIQLIALFTAPVTALLALAYGALLAKKVLSEEEGNDTLKRIAAAIKDGAMAYLARQFKIVSIFMVALSIPIAVSLGIGVAVTFILGTVSCRPFRLIISILLHVLLHIIFQSIMN